MGKKFDFVYIHIRKQIIFAKKGVQVPGWLNKWYKMFVIFVDSPQL